MNNEKMREEFERWARSKSIPVRRCVTGERDYVIYEVDLTWQAWKASRENIEVELPSDRYRLGSVIDYGHHETMDMIKSTRGDFYEVEEVKQKLTEQGFKVNGN